MKWFGKKTSIILYVAWLLLLISGLFLFPESEPLNKFLTIVMSVIIATKIAFDIYEYRNPES